MKCPNPNCKKEIEPDSRFCPQCGTPIPPAPDDKGDISGVQTGDIGYVEGNITDASQHGRSYVGSVVVQTGKHNESSIVTCPICGRRNELMNTFECIQCHEDYLCLRHQDEETNLCEVCTGEPKIRVRRESLEREARAVEAAGDLEGAISKLDQLIVLVENRQTTREWKARLVQEIEKRQKEELREPLSAIENTLGMKFILLPAGTFTMGSPTGEPWRRDDETQHQVTLTISFYLQTTPLTQGQWQAMMGNNPSYFDSNGLDCPVERVSWDDVQEFIQKLNQSEGISKYRLPTEAEWEYACRAGSEADYCFGVNKALLAEYCWYNESSDGQTQPVGQMKPNAWGLYDMHGNVWEWCQDWYGDYPPGSVIDPQGPSSGLRRVDRGGGWGDRARGCRSAIRSRNYPGYLNRYLGFRLAMDP